MVLPRAAWKGKKIYHIIGIQGTRAVGKKKKHPDRSNMYMHMPMYINIDMYM